LKRLPYPPGANLLKAAGGHLEEVLGDDCAAKEEDLRSVAFT
jgi:hypothetical protein